MSSSSTRTKLANYKHEETPFPHYKQNKKNTSQKLTTFFPPKTAAAAFIIFNPTFWNTAARSEYRNKTLTRLAGNNAYRGCYALAVTIFSLGLIRDYLYAPSPPFPPQLTPAATIPPSPTNPPTPPS